MDILTGDGILSMTISELESKGTEMSRIFAESLVVRYVQRRNTEVLQLMRALEGDDADDVPMSHPLPPGKLRSSAMQD